MKVVVFGASHGLGREVVQQALDKGMSVTAFSRSPGRIGLSHQNLRLFAGDVENRESVSEAVETADAVVCTLGLPTLKAIGPPVSRKSYVLSGGTANIVAGMKRHRIQRFVCETAIGSGDSVRDCSLLARLAFRVGLRWLFKEKDAQEKLVRASGLDWTLVRPSALTNGPRPGEYLVSGHTPVGILTHISRADAAEYIVAAIGDAGTIGKAVTITYPPRLGDSLRWARNFR